MEGVFASKVLNMAFCVASVEGISESKSYSNLPRMKTTTSHRQQSSELGRLVCVGRERNGRVSIKGLAISSMSEMFHVDLVDDPTCVSVASGRAFLAIGYGDGNVHAVTFCRDRC